MNMYYDTPRDFIGGVYDELLFGDHPLGWDMLGRKETIESATRDTFMGYLDRWYKPERIVVGLGGAVGDSLLEKLGELLGDLGAADTGTPDPAPALANGARVKIHSKQADQAHLCIGFPGYPLRHPDRYTAEVLRVVLGGGMSSRLWTEVRERRGLAYYCYAMNQAYTDTGTLVAQAGVDIKRIDEAITTMAGELRKIAAEPVPAEELTKACAYAKGRFVLQLENPHGTNMFGLRRGCWKARRSSRPTCSPDSKRSPPMRSSG